MRVHFIVQAQEDRAALPGALVGCAVYGGDHPRGTQPPFAARLTAQLAR